MKTISPQLKAPISTVISPTIGMSLRTRKSPGKHENRPIDRPYLVKMTAFVKFRIYGGILFVLVSN